MPPYDDDSSAGRKVYIGNLNPDVTSDEIEDMFQRYGKIQSVWVARNPPGFAFVTFEDPRDARDAVQAVDGVRMREKYLRVEVARGSGSGGRGGRSRGGYRDRDDRGGYGRDRGYGDRGYGRDRDDRGGYDRGRGSYRSYSRSPPRDRSGVSKFGKSPNDGHRRDSASPTRAPVRDRSRSKTGRRSYSPEYATAPGNNGEC